MGKQQHKDEKKVIKMKPQGKPTAKIVSFQLHTGFSKEYSILMHTFMNHA